MFGGIGPVRSDKWNQYEKFNKFAADQRVHANL